MQEPKTAGKRERQLLNWGLVSEFRTELMGLAIVYVILLHFAGLNANHNLYWKSRLFQFLNAGNAGVDLFLILSGVGLYFSYSQNQKDFCFRRLIRLIVPYLLIGVPYYVWYNIASHGGWKQLLKDVTQWSLFTEGMKSTWFVPVILVLSLLYPLIDRAMYKNKRIPADCMCVILCSLLLLINVLLRVYCPAYYKKTEIFLIRPIAFVFGCYLGSIVKEKKPFSSALVLFSISYSFFLLFVFRPEVSIPVIWIRMSIMVYAMAFMIISIAILNRFGHSKVLQFFGKRSLEIYLFHVLLRNVYFHYLKGNREILYLPDYAIIVMAALIASVFAHYLISKLTKQLLSSMNNR